MRILITGITGFAGSHLADYLASHHPDAEAHGIYRWRSATDNITQLLGKVQLHQCDIKDAHNVYEIIEHVRPDKIFHLAAQSFVPASWDSPAETLHTNIVGQCNLLEAARKLCAGGYDPVIQIAGSSEEYGMISPDDLPIKESTPLCPMSPYAVSKVAQDHMGFQYYKSYGLRIIRTRAFNHDGPRRPEVFVTSNFAKQLAEISKGLRPPVVRVGNLEAVRDFSDVRDVARAYWMATERCSPGEVYNIASGTGYKIRQVLDRLIELSGVQGVQVEADPARMRPSDVPILIGDSRRFREATGWEPHYSFWNQTLSDLLDYWRMRV